MALAQIQPATKTHDGQPHAVDDPLVDCLCVVTRLHGRPVSAAAMVAGLPLEDGRLTPLLSIRAVERHGFSARIVKRPLKRISKLLLPATLLLKDSAACVLTGFPDRKTAEIIMPETGIGVRQIELAELAEQYTGYALFLQPVIEPNDSRLGPALERPGRSWFWGTMWRYRRYYVEAMVAGALVNVLTVATALFIMNVYDRVVPNNAFETLAVLAVGTAVAIGLEFLARNLRAYFLDTAGKKADLVLASTLFGQAIGLKMAARPSSAGAFAAQLKEFESLRDFITSVTLTALIDIPFIAFFIWIILLIGGPLYNVPLLVVPVVVIVGLIAQIPLARLMRAHLRETALKHGLLIESVEGMEILKTLCAEGQMQGRFEDYTALTARTATRARLISGFVVNFAVLAQQMTTVLMVVWGVYLIAAGQLTVGALIACVILTGRGLAPLQQVASLMTRYQTARASFMTLDELMHRPTERPPARKFVHRPHVKGAVTLERVNFAYPGQKLEALRNISLSIKAGEHIGILGRIGSGKSTLLKLILGLYSPAEGAVRIDDVDLEQYDPVDLRRNIAYVAQDTSLFYGTLRENITMGLPHADDAAVLEAARLSGLDKMVNQHPDGFGLTIGERGEGLSGGQRQATAVARAVLKSPPIVLLDEPTSAMDHSAEQAFISGMRDFLKERTLVLVTHKPTMLNLVSRIVVIDQGQVAMDGPRDEVLKRLMQQANQPVS